MLAKILRHLHKNICHSNKTAYDSKRYTTRKYNRKYATFELNCIYCFLIYLAV